MTTNKKLTVQQAADWFIEHFGEDLPEGDNWYWIEDVGYYDEIPETDNYLIAGEHGLEGIYLEYP